MWGRGNWKTCAHSTFPSFLCGCPKLSWKCFLYTHTFRSIVLQDPKNLFLSLPTVVVHTFSHQHDLKHMTIRVYNDNDDDAPLSDERPKTLHPFFLFLFPPPFIIIFFILGSLVFLGTRRRTQLYSKKDRGSRPVPGQAHHSHKRISSFQAAGPALGVKAVSSTDQGLCDLLSAVQMKTTKGNRKRHRHCKPLASKTRNLMLESCFRSRYAAVKPDMPAPTIITSKSDICLCKEQSKNLLFASSERLRHTFQSKRNQGFGCPGRGGGNSNLHLSSWQDSLARLP